MSNEVNADTPAESLNKNTQSKTWLLLNPNPQSLAEKKILNFLESENLSGSRIHLIIIRSMSEFFDHIPTLPEPALNSQEASSIVFLFTPEFLGPGNQIDATGNAFIQALFEQPRFAISPFIVLNNLENHGLIIDPPQPARCLSLPATFEELISSIQSHIQIRLAECSLKFKQGCAIVFDSNPEQIRQICIFLEQTEFGPVYGISNFSTLKDLLTQLNSEPGILILSLESDSSAHQQLIRWIRRNPKLAGTPIMGIRPYERKLENDLPMNHFSYPPDLLIGRPIRPLLFFQATQNTHGKSTETKYFQRYIAQGYIFLDQGNASEAKLTFQKAEGFIPRQAESSFGIGLSYSLAGDTSTAIEYFQRSLQIRPHFEEAILAFALQLFKLNYSDEAFELLIEGQTQLNKSFEIPLLGLKKAVEKQRFNLSQRFSKRLRMVAPLHPELEKLDKKSQDLKKVA